MMEVGEGNLGKLSLGQLVRWEDALIGRIAVMGGMHLRGMTGKKQRGLCSVDEIEDIKPGNVDTRTRLDRAYDDIYPGIIYLVCGASND